MPGEPQVPVLEQRQVRLRAQVPLREEGPAEPAEQPAPEEPSWG